MWTAWTKAKKAVWGKKACLGKVRVGLEQGGRDHQTSRADERNNDGNLSNPTFDTTAYADDRQTI